MLGKLLDTIAGTPSRSPAVAPKLKLREVPARYSTTRRPDVAVPAAAVRDLRREALPIERGAVEEVGLTCFQARYSELDMSFLRHNTAGIPTFAMFSLRSPVCRMPFEKWGWLSDWRYSGSDIATVPWECANHVEASVASYLKKLRGYNSVEFTARFPGLIPAEIREKIAAVREDFETTVNREQFSNIWLVMESPGWSIEHSKTSFSGGGDDPLVIGRKHDRFWLIDSFNLTSAEQCVQDLCQTRRPGAVDINITCSIHYHSEGGKAFSRLK